MNTNMATISLFWNTNMAAVTSCENALSRPLSLEICPNSACSHWLLRGYLTSNNETVSRQNLSASNIEKSTATCKRTQHSRAKSLTDFKLCATTPNKAQQHDDRVCKRTQHVTSNNVASICTGVTVHCYPQMLTDDCRYSEV